MSAKGGFILSEGKIQGRFPDFQRQMTKRIVVKNNTKSFMYNR